MLDSLKTGGGNNFGDNELAVLKQAKPYECGGTDASLDKSAPKQIDSEDMILFEVTSSFAGMVSINPQEESPAERLGYVSAFAAPLSGGTFIFLEKSAGFNYGGERKRFLAPVKENIFPPLVNLVREFDFAKSNGFHSVTYGLPENFGGSVNIRYASGEMISFSNNQAAVISPAAGQKIADIFTCALNGEKLSLPDVSELKEIVYFEERENGGFTKAVLTLNPDGTGTNKKSSRYDDPTVYESEKVVDAETIDIIKNNITRNCMFAWQDLPESGFPSFEKPKTITFNFFDWQSITVTNNKALPLSVGNAFFNIELELTTKN